MLNLKTTTIFIVLLLSSWKVSSAEFWIKLQGNQDVFFLISNEKSHENQNWGLYTQNMQPVQENLLSIIAYPLDMNVFVQFSDGEIQTYTLASHPPNFDISPNGNEQTVFHLVCQNNMWQLYSYPWSMISDVSILAIDFVQQIVNITFPEESLVYQYNAINFQPLLPAAGKHHLTKISR